MIGKIFGVSWCTSRICVVAAAFAIALDVIPEYVSEGLMNESLYADDLLLLNDSIQNLREKFLK